MESNKILSASLIDVIFDGRNKEYGAYELRKTYSGRIKKALVVTTVIAGLAFGGATLANSFKKNEPDYRITPGIVLTEIPDEKPPEKLPEPEPKPETEQVKTEQFTAPEILPDDEVQTPPPSLDDLDSARIDTKTREGKPDIFVADPPQDPGDDKGILDIKKNDEPEGPAAVVDIPAKFIGNWKRFLETNLNENTPTDNGAGPGRYTVIVQFVVDKEGNVSEIKTLTNHGYGLEEEAVRVLKKAPKWEPAIYQGYKVKAFHKQMITFEVPEE
ncbi:MAG: energy transducer TonB [Chitinophagaceae bacterium]